MRRMLIYSCNGPRSIDDARVIFVSREHAPGAISR
jgi:hypothetical protein